MIRNFVSAIATAFREAREDRYQRKISRQVFDDICRELQNGDFENVLEQASLMGQLLMHAAHSGDIKLIRKAKYMIIQLNTQGS